MQHYFEEGSRMPAQSKKPAKKRGIIVLIIFIILAALALTAGFFLYVQDVRLFPNMPDVMDQNIGEDHFAREDFCGIYEFGQSDQTPVHSEASIPILSKAEGGYKKNSQDVSAISVDFPAYTLFPIQQPATVTMYYDKQETLVCARIAYHYQADEMRNLNDDLARLESEESRVFVPNPLFRIYDDLADKLHFKTHNVYRSDSADAPELVIEECYRSNM